MFLWTIIKWSGWGNTLHRIFKNIHEWYDERSKAGYAYFRDGLKNFEISYSLDFVENAVFKVHAPFGIEFAYMLFGLDENYWD